MVNCSKIIILGMINEINVNYSYKDWYSVYSGVKAMGNVISPLLF